MLELKQVDFYGFKNALELTNGIVKLIITTDIGPRILFLRLQRRSELYESF